jgi:hypothetical protein
MRISCELDPQYRSVRDGSVANYLQISGKNCHGRDPSSFGFPVIRSRFGYLCVEGMALGAGAEAVDVDTGEIFPKAIRPLPSHYKCPQTGAVLPVENPAVWVYAKGDNQ